MNALLLVLIYFAFISLGLPDSLLGVSWPEMRAEWQLPLDAAGYITFTIVIATVLSALLSGTIIKKLGAGLVTAISCLMTALSILGFSYAPSFVWLIFIAIPLGFGAGSVDTALNNYVALHFKAHHMNWLHSFWGVGATTGPLIMSAILGQGLAWRMGYRTIASIQLILAFLLFISLPLWKRHKAVADAANSESHNENQQPVKKPLLIKGVPYAMAAFTFYCAAELSVGLWGSSYLVSSKGLAVDTAASYVAMYYGGITLGRFLSGFVSFKLNNIQMIRLGIGISFFAALLLLLPLSNGLILIPLLLFGLGLAPIFPAMIHETPNRFGKTNSQYIIGYQMASAYFGMSIFPPLFGFLLKNIQMGLLPYFLVFTIFGVLFVTERVRFLTRKTA